MTSSCDARSTSPIPLDPLPHPEPSATQSDAVLQNEHHEAAALPTKKTAIRIDAVSSMTSHSELDKDIDDDGLESADSSGELNRKSRKKPAQKQQGTPRSSNHRLSYLETGQPPSTVERMLAIPPRRTNTNNTGPSLSNSFQFERLKESAHLRTARHIGTCIGACAEATCLAIVLPCVCTAFIWDRLVNFFSGDPPF